MKKAIIAIIIIIIIIVGGGYALFHKSKKSSTSPSSSSTTASTNAPAINNSVLTTKTDPSLGQYLADPSGKPLYTYNKDTSGVSNCTGSCLTEWPAYVATSTSNLPAGVSTIKRSDNGQMQYTFNGMPLYYFVNDSAGKVTGNNVEDFVIAKPVAASSSATSSSSSSSNTSSQPSTAPSSSSNGYNY